MDAREPTAVRYGRAQDHQRPEGAIEPQEGAQDEACTALQTPRSSQPDQLAE